MLLNGHEVDFSYVGAEDASRLSDASKAIASRLIEVEEAQKDGWGNTVATTIDCYREYLRTATGIDVLENCGDIETAEDAYFGFLAEVARQKAEYMERRAERIRHYTDLKGLI